MSQFKIKNIYHLLLSSRSLHLQQQYTTIIDPSVTEQTVIRISANDISLLSVVVVVVDIDDDVVDDDVVDDDVVDDDVVDDDVVIDVFMSV